MKRKLYALLRKYLKYLQILWITAKRKDGYRQIPDKEWFTPGMPCLPSSDNKTTLDPLSNKLTVSLTPIQYKVQLKPPCSYFIGVSVHDAKTVSFTLRIKF